MRDTGPVSRAGDDQKTRYGVIRVAVEDAYGWQAGRLAGMLGSPQQPEGNVEP